MSTATVCTAAVMIFFINLKSCHLFFLAQRTHLPTGNTLGKFSNFCTKTERNLKNNFYKRAREIDAGCINYFYPFASISC